MTPINSLFAEVAVTGNSTHNAPTMHHTKALATLPAGSNTGCCLLSVVPAGTQHSHCFSGAGRVESTCCAAAAAAAALLCVAASQTCLPSLPALRQHQQQRPAPAAQPPAAAARQQRPCQCQRSRLLAWCLLWQQWPPSSSRQQEQEEQWWLPHPASLTMNWILCAASWGCHRCAQMPAGLVPGADKAPVSAPLLVSAWFSLLANGSTC